MATHLLTQPVGGTLPSGLGASRPADVSPVAPTVEPRTSDQGAESCRLVRVTRYFGWCAVHGRFGIDEYQQAPLCPGGERS